MLKRSKARWTQKTNSTIGARGLAFAALRLGRRGRAGFPTIQRSNDSTIPATVWCGCHELLDPDSEGCASARPIHLQLRIEQISQIWDVQKHIPPSYDRATHGIHARQSPAQAGARIVKALKRQMVGNPARPAPVLVLALACRAVAQRRLALAPEGCVGGLKQIQ
jgi:hypothetical protein